MSTAPTVALSMTFALSPASPVTLDDAAINNRTSPSGAHHHHHHNNHPSILRRSPSLPPLPELSQLSSPPFPRSPPALHRSMSHAAASSPRLVVVPRSPTPPPLRRSSELTFSARNGETMLLSPAALPLAPYPPPSNLSSKPPLVSSVRRSASHVSASSPRVVVVVARSPSPNLGSITAYNHPARFLRGQVAATSTSSPPASAPLVTSSREDPTNSENGQDGSFPPSSSWPRRASEPHVERPLSTPRVLLSRSLSVESSWPVAGGPSSHHSTRQPSVSVVTSTGETKAVPVSLSPSSSEAPSRHVSVVQQLLSLFHLKPPFIFGENQMSKKEILAKYRVHIFVVAIFIITVLFISLGWFYRDKSEQEDSARQKIFLDPRKRILTLSDGHDEVSVLLGQDIPQWQLPMHCQLVEEDNPNSKECLWKNNAVVRVNFFQERVDGGEDTVGCYNVSWETLRSSIVPYDCFNLGTAEWYGPSNQSDGTWPIQGNFSYVPTPYRMGNNGVFSNVFQPYWLSSTGVGLLLNADEPITLQWNTSRPNYLCVVSNYTGPLYGHTYQSRLPFLNYTICNGRDINQTHRVMKMLVRGATPVDLIPKDVIMNPIWSAKELAGTERYNETHIQDFVAKLKTNGMNCSLLVMDGDWQDKHGDLTFDPVRFANLPNMTELVQTACSLSLEVTPYFDYRSVDNFHHGVVENFFVRDDGGLVPGLTRYRPDKAGAMVDVTRPEARTWFGNTMKTVLDAVKPRSLRLVYGQDGWLPYRPTFSDPSLSLQGFKQLVGDSLFDPKRVLIQDHAVLSKRSPGLVAVTTDVVRKDNHLCLDNAIQKALTLGLLGYPFVLADGLAEQPDRLSPDLFIRWMQMAAFFPAFKFSWAPWSQSEDVLNQAKNLSLLHSTLVVGAIQSVKVIRDVEAGLPILRPSWWLDPANQTVHAMGLNDEFLVGDELLVAPILCEGVTVRDIYVPPGVWGDRLKNNILVQGPKILSNYRIELNEVAYFVRMKVYNGKER